MHLPGYAARAVERLEQAGFETWAVGGCVRDSLRGIRPHDWDLCTAAAPEEMLRVFEGEQVIETGLKHGTLTVILDGSPLEITTYRTDGGYSDGRHPDGVRLCAASVRTSRGAISRSARWRGIPNAGFLTRSKVGMT